MSFFDKFFSNRNRNNSNENALTPESELLWSSHLNISKDQIRFILFRECDKRGRKLLFDSNSVEKVTLPLRENMCNHNCQQQNEKMSDFIEMHKTHAYKYKKPSSDVSSLGELVFGSVAVIYKGENSCKIHSIPSPKSLMFSTIVSTPSRCSASTNSEVNSSDSRESSLASLSNILNQQQQASSSDSKLYKREGASQKYSSTYPWIKQTFPFNKLKRCCEISGVHENTKKKSFLKQSSDLKCFKGLCPDKRTRVSSECGSDEPNPAKMDQLLGSENNLCLCQKNFECERDSNNCDSSGITSNESENLSSISSSLSSLKRRWIHSYSTSLDSATFDDSSSSSSRKRTKLGLALVLDLSNTLEDEVEKLLFNHTIVIDSAMCKLQACVELAYIRNESFVDLIHAAFLECQQSIHKLITGGKYEMPMWCLRNSDECLETRLTGLNLREKNMGVCPKQDFVNNLQLKFLIDFCDVLAKFDTKDTNFFISTLLTAVLTHHLSWVTSIAETDLRSNEKLSVISGSPPYNPIWAQMNDLCGLLGSPLKSAKTVVTGTRKNQVTAIIKVLSYFIRCNNVVENIYEVDVEDVVGNVDSVGGRSTETESEKRSVDAGTEGDAENRREEKREVGDKRGKETPFLKEPDERESGSCGGLKRTKSCLSPTKMEDDARPKQLYPDIKDLAKCENVYMSDLDHVENERTIAVESFLNSEKHKEKIEKMIRVPRDVVAPPPEGLISLDEGYDTIHSTKTEDFKEKRVQMERQRSAPPEERSGNIVFLLGDNEELVNLQRKIVVRKSSFVDMEKEDSREFGERDEDLSDGCVLRVSVADECESERSSRTSKNDRTFRSNCASDKVGKGENLPAVTLHEIKMPRITRPRLTRRLEVSSVMGGVNEHYNSEQIVQGVLEPKNLLEQKIQKDLLLCARNPILEKNVKEALCVLGDMDSWEVSILSGNGPEGLNREKRSGIRVGMSQLVADMLESFQYLHTLSLPPSFCLDHIEKKLGEIYLKSKTVAELLSSTELCSMEYLTTKLNIGISDVPLLLSVATTHSPHIAEKYVLSFS